MSIAAHADRAAPVLIPDERLDALTGEVRPAGEDVRFGGGAGSAMGRSTRSLSQVFFPPFTELSEPMMSQKLPHMLDG